MGHSWAIWEPILATQDDFKSLWRKSILCTRALSLGRSLKPRQGSKAQWTTVATLGIDPHVFWILGGTKLKPVPYPGREAKNFSRDRGKQRCLFLQRVEQLILPWIRTQVPQIQKHMCWLEGGRKFKTGCGWAPPMIFPECVSKVPVSLWGSGVEVCSGVDVAQPVCNRCHYTLYTSTLYTPHSLLHTFTTPPHYALHSTLPHSTLYTPHYTLHSTLFTLHFTLHTLHFTLRTLHFTLYTLYSTLYTPHFTLHTPHFTLHTLHYTPHSTSTLYTLDSALHALHSTLHTLHSTLLHSTLYIPHFTAYTLYNSTL